MAWAKNGTPHTLTGVADEVKITDLTAKEFNVFLFHDITSSNTDARLRFNNDSATKYSTRRSTNGGTDVTNVSQGHLSMSAGNPRDEFAYAYAYSISGKEKLVISMDVKGATGAANAPERMEQTGKYVPSPDADITEVNVVNADTGDFGVDTNLSALGTD